MSAFFQAIIAFLQQLAQYLLDGITYLLQFIVYTLVDGVLTVITFIFLSLDLVNSLASWVCDWTGLPSQLGYVIGKTGIASCIGIMLAAVTIRVAINLIPSWATRV